jgi:hypothetical protein
MNTPMLYLVTINGEEPMTLGVLKPDSARVAVIALARGWLLNNQVTACEVVVAQKFTDSEFGQGFVARQTSWIDIYKLSVSNMVGRWELIDSRFAIKSIEPQTPELL